MLSLKSEKDGEIKRFLSDYFEKEVDVDEDVMQWSYVYNKPLDAVDIISVLMDNVDSYDISMMVQFGIAEVFKISKENHNDVVKGLLYLFYTESCDDSCMNR